MRDTEERKQLWPIHQHPHRANDPGRREQERLRRSESLPRIIVLAVVLALLVGIIAFVRATSLSTPYE
jgi:hypothetical protein